MRMSTLMRMAALSVAVLGLAPSAQAAPITYTQTGIASGSLNGVPFVNQLVTVTVTGNTINVIDMFVPEINDTLFIDANVVTTVAIPGRPVAVVTQPSAIYRFPFIPDAVDVDDELPNLPFILIATLDSPPNLLEFTGLGLTAGNMLGSYDLRGSIGPITGPGGVGYAQSQILMTNQGALRFTSGSELDDQGTFTAAVGIPEPTSMLLVASGIAGVIARRARARRRA